MSKAFTRENDAPEEELEVEPRMPDGTKNYITPAGHARLKGELKVLVENERPELIKTWPGRPPMATARKTPTTSTGRSGCARSSAASAFS